MIIWDKLNLEHIIRCGATTNPRLTAASFGVADNNAQIERKVKKFVDDIIEPVGYHLHVHIFSKAPLSYLLWLGSIDQKPTARLGTEWWESQRPPNG